MELESLDWLVAIFTISSGLVLALAAVLAYLVHRARYLRETDPDLQVTWTGKVTFPPPAGELHPLSEDLRKGWTFWIELRVENRSQTPGQRLRMEGQLVLDLDRSREKGLSGIFEENVWLPFTLHIMPEILPGRTEHCDVLFSSSFLKDPWRLYNWPEPILTEKVGFWMQFDVEYYTPRELLMFFLWPLGLGRKKCRRRVSGGMKFVPQEGADQLYEAQPWRLGETN